MKFWIIVIACALALCLWGWWSDRRRRRRGGLLGDTSDAARQSQAHDNARGGAPGINGTGGP